jgi:hypothetical protein
MSKFSKWIRNLNLEAKWFDQRNLTTGQKNSYTPEGKKKCRNIKHTMRKLVQYRAQVTFSKPTFTKWMLNGLKWYELFRKR